MNLSDVLRAVREENLSLQNLEKYRDSLIHFKTDLHEHIAELKKKRAQYLVSTEGSVASRKMAFDGTDDGQRLLSLQGHISGLQGEIDSLQGRIYGQLRLQG